MAGIIGTKIFESKRAMRWKGLSLRAAISELAGRDIGGFRFTRFTDPGFGDKGGVDFVDHPGAKNHLQLSGITETAFYPVDFSDRAGIRFGVIDQHQPEPGRAVRRAGNILFAPQQRQ